MWNEKESKLRAKFQEEAVVWFTYQFALVFAQFLKSLVISSSLPNARKCWFVSFGSRCHWKWPLSPQTRAQTEQPPEVNLSALSPGSGLSHLTPNVQQRRELRSVAQVPRDKNPGHFRELRRATTLPLEKGSGDEVLPAQGAWSQSPEATGPSPLATQEQQRGAHSGLPGPGLVIVLKCLGISVRTTREHGKMPAGWWACSWVSLRLCSDPPCPTQGPLPTSGPSARETPETARFRKAVSWQGAPTLGSGW